jgi:hypothetical protein
MCSALSGIQASIRRLWYYGIRVLDISKNSGITNIFAKTPKRCGDGNE